MAVVTQGSNSCGAGMRVFCLEQSAHQRLAQLVVSPQNPQGFDQVMLVVHGGFVHSLDPLFHAGHNFGIVSATQFTAGAIAGAILGKFEIFA